MCFKKILTLSNEHDTGAYPEENVNVNNKNTLHYIVYEINMSKVLFNHPFVNSVGFYKFRAGNNLNPSTLNHRNHFQLHLIGLGGRSIS